MRLHTIEILNQVGRRDIIIDIPLQAVIDFLNQSDRALRLARRQRSNLAMDRRQRHAIVNWLIHHVTPRLSLFRDTPHLAQSRAARHHKRRALSAR